MARVFNAARHLQRADSLRGSILLLAMVFLAILGLTANSLLQSSALAVRMASNFHRHEVVVTSALGIAREVGSKYASFDPAVNVGYVRCLQGSAATDCDAYDLEAPDALAVLPVGVDVEVRVMREAPFELLGADLSQPVPADSVALALRYAVYRIEVLVIGEERVGAGTRVTRAVAVRQPVVIATPEGGANTAQAQAFVDLYWTESGVDAL